MSTPQKALVVRCCSDAKNGALGQLRLAHLRLAALLLLACADASAFGTHCTPAETVAFSCLLASSKVVSVCLVKGSSTNPSALSYRFGQLGAPELIFPSSPLGSAQKFRYAHYARYQVDRAELSFSNGSAKYTVFSYFDGAERPEFVRGVNVTVDGKDHSLRCKGDVISDLIDLEKITPCNTDSALASCK